MRRAPSWRSVRYAALTVALVCGLGWSLLAAEAQVSPAEPVAVAETAGDELLEPEVPSPWSFGLVTSTIALTIGGVSAVLGIWIDRDKSRPVVFAGAMSTLIVSAVSVGLIQGYLDATGAIQQKEDLKRMMDMVNEIAVASGDPELAALVQSEGGPVVVVPPPAPAPEPAAVDPAAADPAAVPTPGH